MAFHQFHIVQFSTYDSNGVCKKLKAQVYAKKEINATLVEEFLISKFTNSCIEESVNVYYQDGIYNVLSNLTQSSMIMQIVVDSITVIDIDNTHLLNEPFDYKFLFAVAGCLKFKSVQHSENTINVVYSKIISNSNEDKVVFKVKPVDNGFYDKGTALIKATSELYSALLNFPSFTANCIKLARGNV